MRTLYGVRVVLAVSALLSVNATVSVAGFGA
jgi:hypothetical protein